MFKLFISGLGSFFRSMIQVKIVNKIFFKIRFSQSNFLVLQCSEMIMPFAFGQHCQQPPERPLGRCKSLRGIPWCCAVKSQWRPWLRILSLILGRQRMDGELQFPHTPNTTEVSNSTTKIVIMTETMTDK